MFLVFHLRRLIDMQVRSVECHAPDVEGINRLVSGNLPKQGLFNSVLIEEAGIIFGPILFGPPLGGSMNISGPCVSNMAIQDCANSSLVTTRIIECCSSVFRV